MAGALEQVRSCLHREGFTSVAGREWTALRELLPGISESTLRKHLLALEIPMDQPWRGVDTASLDSLEQTLNALAEKYAENPANARAAVITAKDKTRFILRNPRVPDGKKELKREMVDWMLVWLGDPAIFADWCKLRRSQLSRAVEIPPA